MSEPKPTGPGDEAPVKSGPAAPDVSGATANPTEHVLPPQEVRLPDGRIEHPRVRYQPGDAPLAAVLVIMAAVIGYSCLHYAAAWWFFRDRERSEQEAKQSSLPPSLRSPESLPVEPRLEQLDRVAEIKSPDVNRRLAIDEAYLNSYGPAPDEGFVHVPIDRAMDYLVGRLPVRTQQDDEPVRHEPVRDRGLINAGDSNSGRMFRGRP